jgi:glycosyltransferase involved in cell wall biosynthesis
MPRVSVIINVRNGASTLAETIDSVLAQTFADWELVVWDDRSTDTSAEVVRRYTDPRIRYYLSPDDAPLGKARSDAIARASGEWLAFLDQDDVWLPFKLQKQMALADEDVGLIYGRTIRFYPSGRERDYDWAHEYELLPEGDIFLRLFTESCFIAMSSAVFRRSAIESIGGIPKEVRIVPDYYLYVAVAKQYRIRAAQEPLCRYRMHPGSMSQVTALAMHEEVLWLIDRWSPDLGAPTVALCRRRHHTAIALEEIRQPSGFLRGMRRLVHQGSPGSQLARPFLFVFHVLRRRFRTPYWRRLSEKPGV